MQYAALYWLKNYAVCEIWLKDGPLGFWKSQQNQGGVAKDVVVCCWVSDILKELGNHSPSDAASHPHKEIGIPYWTELIINLPW